MDKIFDRFAHPALNRHLCLIGNRQSAPFVRRIAPLRNPYCGCSSPVECDLPKVEKRVQFPSPAFILLAALLFAGCATAPLTQPGRVTPGVPGIYHRVEKGQTLWRISRLYSVDLDELASINRIQDASNIENGQLIFIPRRSKQQSYRISPDNEDFIWPLRGRVTAGFIQSGNNVNKGINIQSATGTDVLASRGGRIVFCSQDFSGYGKTLIIDHGDGYSSVYSGVSQFLVSLGDPVQKGRTIAKSGYSLHFEIRKGYTAQNPKFYLS